jgi:hypothetical protein
MLTCLKDWDLGARKQQHAPVDKVLTRNWRSISATFSWMKRKVAAEVLL